MNDQRRRPPTPRHPDERTVVDTGPVEYRPQRSHSSDRRRRSDGDRGVPIGVVMALIAAIVVGGGLWWLGRDDGGDDATAAVSSTTAVEPESNAVPAACAPLDTLSPRARLAQLIMVGVDPSSSDSVEAVVNTATPVGGVFIGGDDDGIFTDGRLAGIVSQHPVIVAVDDEGGRVQRVATVAGSMPSPRDQVELGAQGIRDLAAARGRTLAALGVTMNFAPVLDISDQADTEVIGDRSYGDDPAVVTRLAGAFAAGLDDAGVMPVFKHFPGHGRADGDSHDEMPTTPSWSELLEWDVVPYRNLAADDENAIMVGHLDVKGLTDGEPASLSKPVYDWLRLDLGFLGLVVTDDLAGMAAVTSRHDVPEAVEMALVAGADLAMLSTSPDLDPILDRLDTAIADGRLAPERVEEAVERVRRAQGCDA